MKIPKWLGKKGGTFYTSALVSVKQYEKGYIIKPYKQEPMIVDKPTAIRIKEILHTFEEAEKTAEAL